MLVTACVLSDKIMDTVTASAGFLGAETRVLVDSVVGFEALVDTGIISLLKVSSKRSKGHTFYHRRRAIGHHVHSVLLCLST